MRPEKKLISGEYVTRLNSSPFFIAVRISYRLMHLDLDH